ncbi:MAG: tyrosine-type recombinase/integrase [Acidimicrobiia bacterium]
MSIQPRDTSRGRVYDVRYRGPDGREISRTFLTKREALQFEARQRTARASGTWVDPRGSKITVKELGEEWLRSNPAKRDSTWARDESALRVHVYPEFGARTIGSLTPNDIRSLVFEWSAGMSPRSVRRTYGALRAALNYAVEVDRLARSPCRGIHLPTVEPARVTVPAPMQLIELADTIDPSYSAMVWLGAVVGLRWGEVAGLRVGHVDVFRRTVTVAEQVTRGAHGASAIGPPKSRASRRTVSMPKELVDELIVHTGSLGVTGAETEALLFPNAEGGPLDYSNWRRRVWEPAVKAAGLSGLGFHDLRRANATAMVAEGVDVKTAQARLGHSDPRLTLAIYAQATTEGDRRAADRLGARLMRSTDSDAEEPWATGSD